MIRASLVPLDREARSIYADKPVMSVVIPNYNGRALLETCLPPLHDDLCNVASAEIIVVDNGSSDESVTWLRSVWPDVTVIELAHNRGYASACNAGAKISRSPIVVFHNNDAIVRPGWSAALRLAIESATDVVIAGGLTLFLDEPTHVNSAGVRIAISGAAIDGGFGRHVSDVDLSERDVAGVCGVSMAVNRAWFDAAGGFDEEFFMYFEDADLCLRAWVEGYRVRFTPDAVVLHAFGGTSGDRLSALRNYYGSRNRLLAAAKSFSIGGLIVAVILSSVQDVAVILWLLASGKVARASAAASGKLRGTLVGIRALPHHMLGPRRAVKRRRSQRDLKMIGVIDPFTASLREFVHMRRVGR